MVKKEIKAHREFSHESMMPLLDTACIKKRDDHITYYLLLPFGTFSRNTYVIIVLSRALN